MVSMENDRYPIEITRVTDGDGFEARALDGSDRTFEVRLYAIDAPEGTQKYGKEATNHLRQLVKDGRLWLEGKGQDPNDRTVAVVYKDSFGSSHTLNYLMVRSGWAYWYSRYDNDDELELREAEVTAFMECAGVWQHSDLERPWDYKERVRREDGEKEQREAVEREERQETVEKEKREAEALADTPDYARRVNAWLREGRYDLVITACTAVIEHDPKQVRPYEFRARAYLKEGKSDLAIADCQAALRLYPENGEIQRLLMSARRVSRAGQRWTTGVSKLSDYVRLSAKGKCHPL